MSPKVAAGNATGPVWFKSSYSTDDGPDCVEVAAAPGAVLVRDSKAASGPLIAVAGRTWSDFVRYASGG